MSKNVMIIGGSYFVGRVFVIKALQTNDFDITVINRGRAPLRRPRVTEYQFDRNDSARIEAELIPQLEGKMFDAIIDTCAYEPGQINASVGHFAKFTKQYIYLSTASVYSTDDLTIRREDDPVMGEPKQHTEMADYVWKKLLLEGECKEACAKHGIAYTILRPAVIFGPFNYSPRESRYIEQIVKHQKVEVVTDATAKFSMVYALDLSRALQLMIGDERAYNEIFNMAAPEEITYGYFYESLERISGVKFERNEFRYEEAAAKNIPVSFPAIYDELYSGEKFCKKFGFEYTPYEEAMAKTYEIFKNVYEG